ncbi:putative feruloyl esterase B precursor [Rosellinia necatrix]|uniref:Carboxylic ester hydrolase n=1 Tax=Rosellinia necatrix TaxID=77044 RepID=A0A1W2TAD3_ROSNE|nr:putative feruloyl esterase B precursor [Rosellinia necatrix]
MLMDVCLSLGGTDPFTPLSTVPYCSPLDMTRYRMPALGLLANAALAGAQCTRETITAILADNAEATVNFVESVPLNGSFGQGASNLAFPVNATQLPALCAVGVNVKSSANSSYNFGLFLPESTWNERFLTTGNGGYGGGINWPDMGRFSHYGFASMSTDTGHISTSVDGSWAFNAPETVIDWGHRAMHGSIVLAKHIITNYYEAAAGIKYSYYASCSTGGRQGLKEIQLHPESFDGISVGAPAWWSPHLSGSTLWQGLYNYDESAPSHIDPSLFSTITAEMKRQCDPQDGLVDNIVSDPYGCNFNFETLLCNGTDSSTCLTPAQLTTLYKFYNDWVDTNQDFVFPGVTLGTDAAFLMASVSPLGSDFFRNFVYNDTEFDITTFSYKDVQFADTINPGGASADDFDLSPFMNRGGKILKYHGTVDSLIPTGSSVYFYKKVLQTLRPMGIDLDDFYRFFLVPDMDHCSGSVTGPWYVAGGSQRLAGTTHSVPGHEDAEHDIILAMMKWVEADEAPDHLIATKYVNDTATLGVQSQRPLCVYPKQAKYTSGDPNEPGSWECKSLY